MTQFLQFLGEDLTYALGWAFVHTLWQGCLIALLMMLALQRTPIKHASRRYAISLGSMLAVLLCAIVTFVIVYPEAVQSGTAGTAVTAPQAIAETTSPSAFSRWIDANMPILVTVWLLGMAFLLLRFSIGLAYLGNLRRSAIHLGDRVSESALRITGMLGIERRVSVAESARVSIPVVIGFVKPLILFPLGAVNQLTTREVEAVLAHEMAHVARNDFIHNLAQSVIEIIFYYHPAVWWISAVVRAERENCCDDLAIQACGDSITYARVLVQLQEISKRSPALALPLARSKSHLLNRVKRILDQPQNKSNAMEKLTATVLLVLCLILASFTAGTDAVPEETPGEQPYAFLAMPQDSIPYSQTIIERTDNGRTVELMYRNGEIAHFKINGEVIPEEKYGEHEKLLQSLVEEAERVTPPPPPPAPPAPPAPHPGEAEPPPAPPAPPAAPEPPTPPKVNKKKTETTIIREKHDNGETTYRVESKGDVHQDIVIDAYAGVARFNGQEITIDADSVIIIEEIETIGRPDVLPHLLNFEGFERQNKDAQAYFFDKDGSFNYAWAFDKEELNNMLNEHAINLESPDWNLFIDSVGNHQLYGYTIDKSFNAEDSDKFMKQWNGHPGRVQGYDLSTGDRIVLKNNDERIVLRQERSGENQDEERVLRFNSGDPGANVYLFDKAALGSAEGFGVVSAFGRYDKDRMLREMEHDGLLDTDGDYDVLLTGKKLKINGKKMPDETLEKYKKMFEKTHGYPIEGKTTIELSNE